MIDRLSRKPVKVNIKMLKEVGYILLLITFFVGILCGAFSFKNVSDINFEQYEESLKENLAYLNEKQGSLYERNLFFQGMKIIGIFWVVGMSIVGTPVLIAYIGYKGFSIGYTISAIIKLLGTVEGNRYIFQNLFLQNVVLVFIMIFLANYSIKIFRTFFESRETIKVDVIKYTIISTFMALIYIVFCSALRIIF